MANATNRQKQFLRQLGHKSCDGLTKEQASSLIDELLIQEKKSGKTFPCPYCKSAFGPRPRRSKTCPSCGQKIIHLSGKFYTEKQSDELQQKEWLADARSTNRINVKEDWKEDRSFRKEFGETFTVGYIIHVGPACDAARHLNGLLVTLEDAVDTPDLLPPYEGCRHDTCECDYEPVSAGEVPKGTRIAEWGDRDKTSKQKTRSKSPASQKEAHEKRGCVGVVGVAFVLATAGWLLINAW